MVHLPLWVAFAVSLAMIPGSPLHTWAHSDPASTFLPAEASQQEYHAPQPLLPATHLTSSGIRQALLTVMLFLLAAVAMAQGVWRRHRTTAFGLAVVLGVFAFGIAVHSVHHFSEPGKAADCLVFSASQHVSASLAEPSDVHLPGLAVTVATPDHPDVPAVILRCRADLPRAPPALLSSSLLRVVLPDRDDEGYQRCSCE